MDTDGDGEGAVTDEQECERWVGVVGGGEEWTNTGTSRGGEGW